MSKEVRIIEHTCDFCGAKQRTEVLAPVNSNVYPTNPEGWRRVTREEHNCGMTGYSRTDGRDACPNCRARAEQWRLEP